MAWKSLSGKKAARFDFSIRLLDCLSSNKSSVMYWNGGETFRVKDTGGRGWKMNLL